jgi:hypothetical protein
LISNFFMDSDGSRPLNSALQASSTSSFKTPRSRLTSPLKPLRRSTILSNPPVIAEPPSAAWARCLGTAIALLTLTLPWMVVAYSNWYAMPPDLPGVTALDLQDP